MKHSVDMLCSVGDTLYDVGYGYVLPVIVSEIVYLEDTSGSYISVNATSVHGGLELYRNSDFDNIVFYSKEDAEKNLMNKKIN